MILSIVCLILGIAAYSISQLAQHGKIKWKSKDAFGFWGEVSDRRKYKRYEDTPGVYGIRFARTNWYTKLAGIRYQERWFTSTNLTVAFTDGYHLMQFFFFLFLSLSFSLALQLENWKQYLLVYAGIHAVHFVIYKTLQR